MDRKWVPFGGADCRKTRGKQRVLQLLAHPQGDHFWDPLFAKPHPDLIHPGWRIRRKCTGNVGIVAVDEVDPRLFYKKVKKRTFKKWMSEKMMLFLQKI